MVMYTWMALAKAWDIPGAWDRDTGSAVQGLGLSLTFFLRFVSGSDFESGFSCVSWLLVHIEIIWYILPYTPWVTNVSHAAYS